VQTLLEDLPDGLPGLLVFNTCTNIIRTLPALVYDKVHTEDVNTKGDDHLYDAIRYMLTDDVTQEAMKKKEKQTQHNPIYGMKNL
jgi:hypothetical protein